MERGSPHSLCLLESGKVGIVVPSYHSPYLGQNTGLGEGKVGSFQKTYNCLDNSVVSFEVIFPILTKELLLSSNANGCVILRKLYGNFNKLRSLFFNHARSGRQSLALNVRVKM